VTVFHSGRAPVGVVPGDDGVERLGRRDVRDWTSALKLRRSWRRRNCHADRFNMRMTRSTTTTLKMIQPGRVRNR
jgi:hypothetical protein